MCRLGGFPVATGYHPAPTLLAMLADPCSSPSSHKRAAQDIRNTCEESEPGDTRVDTSEHLPATKVKKFTMESDGHMLGSSGVPYKVTFHLASYVIFPSLRFPPANGDDDSAHLRGRWVDLTRSRVQMHTADIQAPCSGCPHEPEAHACLGSPTGTLPRQASRAHTFHTALTYCSWAILDILQR